jgi:uncharacterized protein YciI
MFVVILDYIADLSEIDDALSAHSSWLNQNYRSGMFLASGRREPRTGGVIFAVGTRDAVESAVADDPFALRGLARHTVIEFTPSRFGGALDYESVRAALS